MTAELSCIRRRQHSSERKKGGQSARRGSREKKSRDNECRRERKIRHAPPGSTHEIIGSRESTRVNECAEMDQTASLPH